MKFGIVGVIAFIIDWGILNLLVGLFHMHNVLAATISFIISLIFNYVASMKVVFKHRDDMARWMEIVIFVVGAVVGLFMNDAIIWISTYGMNHDAYVSQSAEYLIRTNVGKLIATAVVMVWNFVTRKWLLDDTHTNATNRLKKKENRLIRNSWKPSGRTASRTSWASGRWSTRRRAGRSSWRRFVYGIRKGASESDFYCDSDAPFCGWRTFPGIAGSFIRFTHSRW